jgi:hypothetical protein
VAAKMCDLFSNGDVRMKGVLCGLLCFFLSCLSYGAETSTTPVTIIEIDTNTDAIYFTVSGGTMCSTTAFSLDMTKPRSKEMYSVLLTAASAGKKVKLATWGACKSGDPANAVGNWGTEVQGLFVQF